MPVSLQYKSTCYKKGKMLEVCFHSKPLQPNVVNNVREKKLGQLTADRLGTIQTV